MNNVFKAISDPTRRKILDLLKGGDMTAEILLSILISANRVFRTT